jgi:hypothetical protein
LPFLRFARDRRGYETTALVHAFRGRHGRTRQKLLYWFRTPPSVKVGRPALDEEAIRWIEEHNPDIDFDWPKILESTPPAAPPAEDGKGRRGRRENTDRRGRGSERPAQPRQTPPPAPAGRPETLVAAAPAEEIPAEAVEDENEVQAIDELNLPEPIDRAIAAGDQKAPEERALEGAAPEENAAPEDAAPEGAAPEDAAPEDDTPEDDTPEDDALAQLTHPDAEEPPAGARAPIETLVAREQLIRLRARYAELQARITGLGGDPTRAEELRAQAEPLNPDSWVTSAEAKKGLEEFETRIRDLRAALGLRRRRRSRRGGRRHRGKSTDHASQTTAGGSPSDPPNTPHTPEGPAKNNEPD